MKIVYMHSADFYARYGAICATNHRGWLAVTMIDEHGSRIIRLDDGHSVGSGEHDTMSDTAKRLGAPE